MITESVTWNRTEDHTCSVVVWTDRPTVWVHIHGKGEPCRLLSSIRRREAHTGVRILAPGSGLGIYPEDYSMPPIEPFSFEIPPLTTANDIALPSWG